jgi:uncharacterized DUF497 family protein
MQFSYIRKPLEGRGGIGYAEPVEIEFDPAKDAANVEKHGVSLTRTGQLEIVAVTENSRPEEWERRFRIYGLLEARLIAPS